MKILKVDTQTTTHQVAAQPIPFKIEIDSEYEEFFKKLLSSQHWWASKTVEVPGHRGDGRVDFYMAPNVHLDNGSIIGVILRARRSWRLWKQPHFFVEVSGTTNPIGRFCFSGWGIITLRVTGPALNFTVTTRFNTVMVEGDVKNGKT
jgi:hypothetical protein